MGSPNTVQHSSTVQKHPKHFSFFPLFFLFFLFLPSSQCFPNCSFFLLFYYFFNCFPFVFPFSFFPFFHLLFLLFPMYSFAPSFPPFLLFLPPGDVGGFRAHPHRSRSLGITAKRAQWFVRWTEEVSRLRVIHMVRFEELGRILYAAGALKFERHFLRATLQVYVHAPEDLNQDSAGVRCPSSLQYFARQVQQVRHCDCASVLHASSLGPRVHAEASAERTGIGGWAPGTR